jgi:peptide/nickel transport system permease protein
MFAAIGGLLKHDGRFLFGFVVVLLMLVLALLSFVSPYDPRTWSVVPLDLPPSFEHLLGTNSMGQDVFWTMTHAIRGSLTVGILSVIMSRVVAILVGLVAGYRGGFVDRALMSLNDGFVVMPVLAILIFFGFVLKDSMNVFLLSGLLALFGWAWDARMIRALTLSLREREFTDVAVFSGMSTIRVVLGEYLPFAIPLILATTMTNMLFVVQMEITLAVFGLSSLELPTIGTSIYWANQYQALFRGMWWWIFSPVVITILLFVGLYMLSTSINEFLDPRTRLERITLRSEG